jgi:transcriptional regulator with XRE-family HTH domain
MTAVDVSVLPHDLARAARVLSHVSIKHVAADAGVDPAELREFERGRRRFDNAQQQRVREALQSYGVVFIDEDEAGGYGVRRRHTVEKVRRLESWEGEGGSVSDDAI